MSKSTDRILDIIDAGLQTPVPDPSFGEVSPVNDGRCVRCQRAEPDGGSEFCGPCRAFLLGDLETDPARSASCDLLIEAVAIDQYREQIISDLALYGNAYLADIHGQWVRVPPTELFISDGRYHWRQGDIEQRLATVQIWTQSDDNTVTIRTASDTSFRRSGAPERCGASPIVAERARTTALDGEPANLTLNGVDLTPLIEIVEATFTPNPDFVDSLSDGTVTVSGSVEMTAEPGTAWDTLVAYVNR